jgi:hypothetical protein
MKFMSIREFREKTGMVRETLVQDDEIILTASGKPFAMVSAINPDLMDKELNAVRRARAKVALEQIQFKAIRNGTSKMTMAEIDSVISESRQRTNRK